MRLHRTKSLGLIELIAIALGGMVGGGIFTILGISASIVGFLTPVAIIVGGILAAMAAYSYVKLGLYYKDEGATYSFFKKTYPRSHFAASAIGWYIVFGYISTLALYAFTFASYAISDTVYAEAAWFRKLIATGIITVFALINVWSVKGMGRIEDLMVYTKLAVLAVISFMLMRHGQTDFDSFVRRLAEDAAHTQILSILIVASLTFVAYEGFQLVIHAFNEMRDPEHNIPRAIYAAIAAAILIYVIIALGALFAIPIDDLVRNKEFALAAGAQDVMGAPGKNLVIGGALLATSSAISGTVFGASRLMAVIAEDRYLPPFLAQRVRQIPRAAILAMALSSILLIWIGGLRMILEFGSITFILVSLLMAVANHKIHDKTGSSVAMTWLTVAGLGVAGILILYYEFSHNPRQMAFICTLYVLLTIGARRYAAIRTRRHN